MSDDMLEKHSDDVGDMGKSDATTNDSRVRVREDDEPWQRKPSEFPWERLSHHEYNLTDRSCRRIHKVLRELMNHGTISVACTRANMDSGTFNNARKHFPSLVEATELAISHAVEQVEAIAFDCAMKAKDDPRYLKATELVLKCKGGWRETQRFEHTGPDGGAIQQNIDLSGKTVEELERLLNTANNSGVESTLDG